LGDIKSDLLSMIYNLTDNALIRFIDDRESSQLGVIGLGSPLIYFIFATKGRINITPEEIAAKKILFLFFILFSYGQINCSYQDYQKFYTTTHKIQPEGIRPHSINLSIASIVDTTAEISITPQVDVKKSYRQ